MASEPVLANEATVKAVTDVAIAPIQAVAAAMAERPQKHGRTQNRQTCQETAKLQLGGRWQTQLSLNLRLEVNNILTMYNTPQTEQLAIVRNWSSRNGLQFIVIDTYRKRCMQNIRRLIQNIDQQI